MGEGDTGQHSANYLKRCHAKTQAPPYGPPFACDNIGADDGGVVVGGAEGIGNSLTDRGLGDRLRMAPLDKSTDAPTIPPTIALPNSPPLAHPLKTDLTETVCVT